MFPIRNADTGARPGSRRLVATLALAALLAAFALPAPAVAQPGSIQIDAQPLTVVFQWLDGLLAGLDPAPADSDAPEAAFLPEGCGMDPLGSPCADDSSLPPVPDVEEGLDMERPRTR